MRRTVLASLALISLVAAGCGLAEDEIVLTADSAGEIVIDMDEFSFGADRIEVTAGETVTFVIVNAGANEHEFMIGRDLIKTELGYPNGFEHDFFEDVTPIVDPPNAGMDMGAMDMSGGMDGMDMSDGEMSDGAGHDDEMSDEEMDGMDMSDDAGHDDEMTDDEMDGMDMSDDPGHDDAPEDGGHGDEEGDMGGDDVHAGFMVLRRAGEVARLTVTIPAEAVGEWEVGCFRGRGSHWDAGMRATLFVRTA